MKKLITITIACLTGFIFHASAATMTVTNASGGIDTYVLQTNSLTLPLPGTTTGSNILLSVPAGVTKLTTDVYDFFTSIAWTNPISVGVFGLQNGSGNYGGGLEVNSIKPGATVNAGFAVAAIQTTETDPVTGKKSRTWGFYDATINLSLSTIETIPALNIPIYLMIWSGPFASLNGGVLIGAQSGMSGDLKIPIGPKPANPALQHLITLGGGVINCSGAAAKGLKSAMPIVHANYTF
jgi:hypothetical protein